jgi:HEAT repeat protein
VPDLMKLLTGDDDAYRYPAIHVLTSIGAGAVPTLVDTLKEGKANRLDLVAQTLAQIGPAASPAIPEFIKILKGNDAARATWAAQSFPSFGPDSKQAIPDLLAALKSDHFKVRYAAANSLVMIDRNQIPNTIEALTSVLASADANERRQAIWLLASFSDKARPAVPAMLEAMKGETLQARLVIADAVMRIDKGQADTILPTLMEAIQVKKGMPGARQQVNTAVRILTQLGPKAKAAAPALEAMFKKALKDENADIDPYMIANALTRIDASAPILTILIESLNSASAGERNEARYVVEDLIGARALPSLEAAIANGQLRESVEVTGLMKQLRQRTGAVN